VRNCCSAGEDRGSLRPNSDIRRGTVQRWIILIGRPGVWWWELLSGAGSLPGVTTVSPTMNGDGRKFSRNCSPAYVQNRRWCSFGICESRLLMRSHCMSRGAKRGGISQLFVERSGDGGPGGYLRVTSLGRGNLCRLADKMTCRFPKPRRSGSGPSGL
jgi:hypothetical protein